MCGDKRRHFMRLVASALSFAFLAACASSCVQDARLPVSAAVPSVPPAPRTVAHADTANGVVIADEYRWIETASSAELDPWVASEDAYARAVLATLPGRAALRARIAELWRTGVGDVDETLLNERAGRKLVVDYSLDRPRLGVRDGDGPLRILHDSVAEGPEKGSVLRQVATRLSPDGRHATVGFVERGEANPRLRIIDVATAEWLPETLAPPLWADAQGFHVAWLDGEHLLWVRNPTRTAATPDREREFNGHVYLHRLGTPLETDLPLFGASLQSAVRADDTPYPAVSADGRWVIIRLRRAAGRALWVAPMEGSRLAGPFREVLSTEGIFRGSGVGNDTLWAITPDGAPRHRLVRVPLLDRDATPQSVLEGEDGVLSGLAVGEDAVYFTQRDGAVSSLWRLTTAGKRVPIKVSRSGNFDEVAVGPDGRGARVRLRSLLHPDEWLEIEPAATEARPVRSAPTGLPPELDRYTVTISQAPARDGVLVPVTILHRRDAPRDGTGFVRLEAYGCFGTAQTPFYDPSNIAWLERGGTLAVAHVRGGSEYGQEWHQASVRRGHATAYEDIVDVVKSLVRDGWAGAGRLALTGVSCGAANVGVAALERPDLIAGAALLMGGVDEWRGWSETASGARSVFDTGDPASAVGVRRIVAASPYHQLIPGARQPAFFLLNGGTDYTIPLWMGAKFVARARSAAGPHSGPTLFRVEREAGHGGPVDFDAQVDAYADELSFMLWQVGHPDFQPRGKR